ncbi:MAG TPA: hypothetical protein VNG71_11550 [Pyrinomonadaceae bacterium]|nr:hypothetical protein [Pyrinomonadaceae bacterium]
MNEEEIRMRRYFLGDLDDRDREAIAEQLLTDQGFAARFIDAETALIDDYVFEVLSESELEKFRENFIIDEDRRKQLGLATALKAYVPDSPFLPAKTVRRVQEVTQVWRDEVSVIRRYKVVIAVSAAVVLMLVLVSPLIIRFLRAPRSPDHRAEVERALAQLNHPPSPIAIHSSAEVALQPTLLRETSELKKVTVTGETKFIRLSLENAGPTSDRYAVSVRKISGEELFKIGDLRAETSGSIPLIVPVEFLPMADYQIELYTGAADEKAQILATYYFRVLK